MNYFVESSGLTEEKLKRRYSVEKTVIEDMTRENGEWRIKVW
jgi:hypothetical protein